MLDATVSLYGIVLKPVDCEIELMGAISNNTFLIKSFDCYWWVNDHDPSAQLLRNENVGFFEVFVQIDLACSREKIITHKTSGMIDCVHDQLGIALRNHVGLGT
jgi:hypothetical protein